MKKVYTLTIKSSNSIHSIETDVKLEDYESLTAELDRLKEELEKVKNTTSDLKKDVTVMPVTGIRWKESEGKNQN